MPADILDLIDSALNDWAVGKDAMRWNPAAGEVEAASTSSADFSLAMLPPQQPFGELSLLDPLPPLLLAGVEPGAVLNVNGDLWRVTERREAPDGTATFILGPFDASEV